MQAEEEEEGAVEEEIVNLGRGMGLEVEAEDVYDLIAEHTDELMTDKLLALQQEQEEERSTEVTEEEGEEVLTTNNIKDFFLGVGRGAQCHRNSPSE